MHSSPPNPFAVAADIFDPPPWEPQERPPLEPHQVSPQGHWSLWLLEGGRGSGKTEACARYFARYMRRHPGHRGRIIAPTYGDAVESCVKGPSGLLSIDPEIRFVPSEPGGSKVIWPNGSEALVLGTHSPVDVDRLRAGGNRHIDWWEEMAANRQLEDAWDQAQLGLRLGSHPHSIGSTTPRPRKAYKDIRSGEGVVRTHATLFDNPHNPREWVEQMKSRYEGTHLGRQEIEGLLIEDIPGALWKRAWLDIHRVAEMPYGGWQSPPVVGVDTADGKPQGDMQSFTVSALGYDHYLYVIEHDAMRTTVDDFAGLCIDAAARHHGGIVLEANHGGKFARSVFDSAMRHRKLFVPIREVHGSQGKRVRAEPVAALYEQGRVRHVGEFPELEDQMTTWTGDPREKSPDRVDSLVWSLAPFTSRSFGPPLPDHLDSAVPYAEQAVGTDEQGYLEGAVAWR